MDTSRTYPKLRWPIDIQHHVHEGKKLLVLRCPLGITSAPLVLDAALTPLLSVFDGSRSTQQIAEQFKAQGVTLSFIEKLLDLLEGHLFLASPQFFAADRKIRDDFLAAEERPAALAGFGYAAARDELSRELAQYLTHGAPDSSNDPRKLLLLKVPHIDYRRGQICYGKSYQQLKLDDGELVILIGTSHQYSKNIFHLTKKHFQSPLGTLRCKHSAVDELALRYGTQRSFADEFLHKREHSLELQVPFLAHLAQKIELLPILVGSFHTYVQRQKLPSEFDEYESFAGALTDLIRSEIRVGTAVRIVAGVDMAHVGRFFGDSAPLNDQFMDSIRERDHAYLAAVEERQSRKLFEHIVEDQDARRVCGYPTMYLCLDLLERLGTPLRACTYEYRQAVDYSNQCAVTFAGMGLYTS